MRWDATVAGLTGGGLMRADVRQKMIQVAKGGSTITYGDLMREFRIPRGHRNPGIGIGAVAGAISEVEHSQGRPMLSAIVVRADSRTRASPQGHPGGGFLGLDAIPASLKRSPSAQQIAALTAEEQKYVREEQERVWRYWRTR